MAASEGYEMGTKLKIPICDPNDIEGWCRDVKVGLRGYKRAHLALEGIRPVLRNEGTAAQRLQSVEEVSKWDEQNDIAIAQIYLATKEVAKAWKITLTYYSEIEANNERFYQQEIARLAMENDEQHDLLVKKDLIAKELLDRLIKKFRGNMQIQKQVAIYEFSEFRTLNPELNDGEQGAESGSDAITRLCELIQNKIRYGEEPSEESKKERLIRGLQCPRLAILMGTIITQPMSASFEDLCTMVENYDQQKSYLNSSSQATAEVNAISQSDRCSYPGCKRPNTHSTEKCFLKKQHESTSHGNDGKKSKGFGPQYPGADGYAGCRVKGCGSKEHLAVDHQREARKEEKKRQREEEERRARSKKKSKKKISEKSSKNSKGERVGFAGVRRDADSRYYSDSGSDGAGNSSGSSDESD